MRIALLVTLLAVPVRADDIHIPEGVCMDPRGCDVSSGSGSSSANWGPPPKMEWGRKTEKAGRMVRECGNKPLCILLRSAVLFPLGLALDAPFFVAKGVVYGGYYGAKGVAAAAKGVGRGVSYPFRAAADRTRRTAYTPVRGCLDRPVSGDSFADYRAWEECKKDVLARQRAYTKRNPSNKANEDWCRGHIPLAAGANRANWEKRCNPDAPAPAAANAPLLLEPQRFSAVPNSEPAVGEVPADPRPVKAASCAMEEMAGDFSGFGASGTEFLEGLRADAEAMAAQLSGERPPEDAKAVQVLTTSAQTQLVKGKKEFQALAQLGLQRFAENGDLHADLSWSVSAPGEKERSGQTLVFLGPDGTLKTPASKRLKRCLTD